MRLFINNVYEYILIHICYHIWSRLKWNCTVTSDCISSTGEGINKFGPRWRDGVSKATVSDIHCRINVPVCKLPWMPALQITSGKTSSCTVSNCYQILLSTQKKTPFSSGRSFHLSGLMAKNHKHIIIYRQPWFIMFK